MKNKKFILIVLGIVVLMIAAGCAAQPRNPERAQTRIGLNNDNTSIRRDDDDLNNVENGLTDKEQIRERNRLQTEDNLSDLDNLNNQNNRRDSRRDNIGERADRIAKKVAKLDKVNNASVLISDRMAIVGLDMKSELEGEETKNLKEKVEKTVKDTDENIENVTITADPDLFTRISNMAEDIMEGEPISGLGDEIEEILRRITPVR